MKKTGCLPVFLFLLVCISMFFNVLLLYALGAKGSSGIARMRTVPERTYEEQLVRSGSGSDKIAVIPLEGMIAFGQPNALGESLVEDVRTAVDQALSDDHVKAIVFSVDSPGGEITASDVLYHLIRQTAEQKPVVYYMNSIGTSGAYYAACGASWLMCADTTFTGSIGVIISTLNYRDLFNKVGLESVVFKSGKFKDMLNGARELTPDEMAYVQSIVMQSYDRFAGIVEKARPNINRPTFREDVADGRVITGQDALKEGLVDATGYIEDAYAKAAELGGATDATVVRYKPIFNFGRIFRMLGQSGSATSKVEVSLPGSQWHLEPGRAYFLPAIFAP